MVSPAPGGGSSSSSQFLCPTCPGAISSCVKSTPSRMMGAEELSARACLRLAESGRCCLLVFRFISAAAVVAVQSRGWVAVCDVSSVWCRVDL